jgi:IPT/TIG domain
MTDAMSRPTGTFDMTALVGPTIDAVTPTAGQRGTVLTIDGQNFSAARLDNDVAVGGAPAFVLAATDTRLTVLTGPDTDSGPVTVGIAGQQATAGTDFTVTGYPAPGDGDDGPPVVSEGVGDPQPDDVNPIGTIRVLVVMLATTDTPPANPAGTRATVDTDWSTVHTYYDQASYGRTNVQYDLTTFADLDGTLADFIDTAPDVQNIRADQRDRVAAIGAAAAVAQGFTLNDYSMLAYVVHTNDTFIRAWGGGSQSTFSYDNGLPVGDPKRISINLTAAHPINTLFINEAANWGRFAHEFGHNVVAAPSSSGDGTATLGEASTAATSSIRTRPPRRCSS